MKKVILKDKKIYIFVVIICFVIMAFSILMDSNLINASVRYFKEPDYRDAIRQASVQAGIFSPNSFFEFIGWFLNISYFSFDTNIIFGTIWFQIILPIFASISAFLFYQKLHGVFSFSTHKSKTYSGFLIRQMLKHSFQMGIAIFAGYILFYLFSLGLAQGVLNDTVSRDLFADLFGKSFYADHVYFYHLLEGFLRFFIMPFIYCFFGQAIALVANHKIIVLLSPCLYYYGLAFVGFGVYFLIGNPAIYVNPTALMASGDYININTPLILLTNSLPLVIGLIIIKWRSRHVEL